MSEPWFVIAAIFICGVIVQSCGSKSKADFDPCHKTGPEVCTTDDLGEMHCNIPGEDP